MLQSHCTLQIWSTFILDIARKVDNQMSLYYLSLLQKVDVLDFILCIKN